VRQCRQTDGDSEIRAAEALENARKAANASASTAA
jgi:hypothetical protein